MLKPWREIAVPHEDVLKGTFEQAEFAADITRVHQGTAKAEYQDSALFFERTYITEGMHLLLTSVVKRLTGKGGDPVIQLQTAFGGGKTHTMLAVYHLARGTVPARNLAGVSAILDEAGATDLPRASIAVLDGINSAPNKPLTIDGQRINTLWGNLAWQLGQAEGYAMVAEADQSGTSPSKNDLSALIGKYAPCVILIDELVAYVRQFEEGKALTGGTFDSNLSFVQSLTEALKAVPTAVLLASLPESNREAGSDRGAKAMSTLSHYFGRVQALWKPVATEEAFEIVRRRLFSRITDQRAAESVCQAFADFYIANPDTFPRETQESKYQARLTSAYPIHPEVFNRLYEDWSTLDNFQRTRGVLKLMAKVIHCLWREGNNDPLIMPGSLPLMDANTRNEAIYYLPQGWNPVIERDVDGDKSETWEIENSDPRLGSVHACRRIARTIFLGSAPATSARMERGIDLSRIMLGAVVPGQQPGLYNDALRRLNDRLFYLNHANDRYWLDTRPNLRREMEERKRRFQDKEDVFPAIRERVQRSFGASAFGGIHVFTASADIPDDWSLRLVILPPTAAFSRTGQSLALDQANEILKKRGDLPRIKQNRLIFLAADYDCISRLKEQVRTCLAWQSIVADIKELKLNLDQFQSRQANKSLDDANEALKRMLRETWKWILSPMQEARPGKGVSEMQWESFQVNTSAPNFSQEIERVLKENELLITEWAPIHLREILKNWFWKEDIREVSAQTVWQRCCEYLYLPRLLDDKVFQRAMGAGADSGDFFGFAQGKEEGRYIGFVYNRRTALIFDTSLILIEPVTAATYAESRRKAEELVQPDRPYPPVATSRPDDQIDDSRKVLGSSTPSGQSDQSGGSPPASSGKTHFFASIEIDPIRAKMQFADVIEEVVSQFTPLTGVRVKIGIEIEVESTTAFPEGTQRTVKENCNVLKFKSAEFE